MKKIFSLVRFFAFLFIIGFVIFRMQDVLGYNDNVHSRTVFRQFYSLPKNSIDAVWLGASSTQEFIIPSEMYEETGISLFSLSLGNEPFMATKNLILEAEKTQNPQIYLVDIRQLAYYTWDDVLVRRVTDNMEFSRNKIETIKYMTGNLRKFRNGYSIDREKKISYIISFCKYHSRWNELNSEDFGEDKNSFFGYFLKTFSKPFKENEIKARFTAEPVPPSEESLQYLNDFLNFCDGFGKKVIFTRTPNCLEENLFAQYNYMQNLIESRGYEVWDMNLAVDEIGLNYASDFADPMHTNAYGAKKVSRYAARKLSAEYGFSDHRGEKKYRFYETMGSLFHKKLREAELRACANFNAYLDKLIALDKNDYTIFIAVKDIQGFSLTAEMTEKLKTLGFDRADILLEHIYHSFIGVIADNRVWCQKIGYNEEPSHYEKVINGQKISIDSKMWLNNAGNLASIKLGTIDYAKNVRGFNFVIVDKQEGAVIDSVAFDTHVAEMNCTR